jgi:hypothetical protein
MTPTPLEIGSRLNGIKEQQRVNETQIDIDEETKRRLAKLCLPASEIGVLISEAQIFPLREEFPEDPDPDEIRAERQSGLAEPTDLAWLRELAEMLEKPTKLRITSLGRGARYVALRVLDDEGGPIAEIADTTEPNNAIYIWQKEKSPIDNPEQALGRSKLYAIRGAKCQRVFHTEGFMQRVLTAIN